MLAIHATQRERKSHDMNEYRLKFPKGPLLALPFSACTCGDRIPRFAAGSPNISKILEVPAATLMKCAD
jgi:hypothetical protein